MAALPSPGRIRHIHLKVPDLPRSLDFYRGVLGFQITRRYNNQAAFISAGGYHHHIGLNTSDEKIDSCFEPTLEYSQSD